MGLLLVTSLFAYNSMAGICVWDIIVYRADCSANQDCSSCHILEIDVVYCSGDIQPCTGGIVYGHRTIDKVLCLNCGCAEFGTENVLVYDTCPGV